MSEKINSLFKPDVTSNIVEGFTERRRQAILLKAGALQNAIFNSAHFSSIATDANGVIQIFNVGAEHMLGYMAVEVMDKVTLAYLYDPQEIIARAETLSVEFGTPIAPGFEALVFKAARGSEDIFELTYIRKDGSRFPAMVTVTALRDDQDVIIGYLLIGTDNTARKQTEEALCESNIRLAHLRPEEALPTNEEHYRTLFESIDEGFCVIEKVAHVAGEPLDFCYVEANPAFTTQSGISNVVGKTIRQVVSDLSEDWFLTYDAVLKTGEPIRFERELTGKGRILELHAFRIEHGTQNRVGISFRDITERKRTEELLRRNHDTFFNMIENAPFGVYVVDAQFRIWQASKASLGAFRNISPLVGRDFGEIMHILWHEAFANEAIKRFRHTLETGEPYVARSMTEQRHNIPAVESYDWRIERITLPDGQFGVVCYYYDLTERMHTENALRESEERYHNLFNSIDEGFCIIEMIFDEHDQPVDYRFLEVNPSFEKHTGLHNAKGKRIREFAPNHEAHWFEIYGRVALTGKPIRFINEAKAIGGYWFDVYAVALGEPENRRVAILFTNITERMKAEVALRQSEERFRALFDRGPIAMYSCDLSGTIQEYNRGAVNLWGMEPQHGVSDEHFGGSLKWYLPDGTLMPYAQTPMAEILQGKISAAYDMEVVIERLDGSRIIVIANIVPLKNDQGEVTGAINCFYDITERKQIELNLNHAIITAERANRAKSHFLSNMSHELRTPLNAILGFAQLMQAGTPPPTDTQAKRLQHIAKAGWYLLELINDILDLAVIEAGRITLTQENVPLTEIMDECQAMTEAQAKKHDVQINWLPVEPCWLAHADHTRVKQVLLNLLSNAIKYNRPHGSVEVKCNCTSDYVRISVKDCGEGLSADKLAQLFQPFNRLGQEAGVEQGTGIGLVVTKKLIELMGGKIGVESTVGVGSEFWIELKRGMSSQMDETPQLDTESTMFPVQAQSAPLK